jgi:hypothetical protein
VRSIARFVVRKPIADVNHGDKIRITLSSYELLFFSGFSSFSDTFPAAPGVFSRKLYFPGR